MPFKCLKFWPKSRQRDRVVPSPRTATPSTRTSASHTRSSIDHGNTVPTSDVSTKPQDESNIPSQAPDLPIDASPASRPATPLSSPSPLGRNLENLWNKAYDSLKVDEESTVKAYEKLLVQRLEELNKDSPLSVSTQITPATLKQPEQLKKFVAAGLEESKKIAAAKENLKEFGQVAQSVKAVMDVVVKAAPEAAIAWSCVSFALQILANPLTESSVNREGITYVLMTMEWYQDLVKLLIDDDSRTQKLRSDLENYIVELYKTLLIYQMKSVCRYNRKEIHVLLRDMVKLDDWTGKLSNVKDAEERVHSKLEQYQILSIGNSIQKLASAMSKQFNELASSIREQTRTQQNAQNQSKRQDCLRALRQTVDPQDEKERIEDEKGNLLRGCYSWILTHERYMDWRQNRSTKILWIAGDPGKGKTMLLCGITDELEKDPTNTLSYFFCQATQETLRSATAVLRGIIYGLVKKYPQLERHILEKYANGGGAAAFAGATAWVVMRNILKAMMGDPYMDGVILVVDALDECVEARQKLLEFICESSRAPDSRAKWILSSRNWSEIEKIMDGATQQTSKLSLESNDHVADAVGKYIKQRVEDLATRTPFAGNKDLCDKVTECLNKNSGDTFLWIALVCNALREGNVEERHVSGPNSILDEFPKGLDNLYDRMLKYIESDTRESDKDLCKHVLAVVSVMRRHVSLEELCSIMTFSTHFDRQLKTLESLVRCCGSFLNIRHGIVYFVHQSAVEFLHNGRKDAFKEIFPQGIEAIHRNVFVSSLKATSKVVRRNIYGLLNSDGREALAVRRDKIIPPQSDPLAPIQYAGIYWIEHLSELGKPLHTDDHEVVLELREFLHSKFLYWVEALALLRQLSQAIQSIQKLQKLVSGIAYPKEGGLSEFIHDANRFLLYHRFTIENTPLQLYSSALLFSPEQSIVRKQFSFEAPDWATVTQGGDAKWDTCLQTLFGHGNSIKDVAYSPDGQWLVSGDGDGTVKLWHVDTGTCVHTISYHEESPVEYGESSNQIGQIRVTSVAFSADSRSFTSMYASGTFKTFDTVKGNCTHEDTALAYLEDVIWSPFTNRMAISKDGLTVAFYLPGKSISVLNMDGVGASRRTFNPLSNDVCAVALTADGSFLASACGTPAIVEIWDTSTGSHMQYINTYQLDPKLIFSADGRWLATGCHSGAMIVWESMTGRLALKIRHGMEDNEEEYEGDYDEDSEDVKKRHNENHQVWSIAFSDESRLSDDSPFIAASYGSRICVWNKMGGLVWMSQEGGQGVPSLSFSPDSLCLVSGSIDHTIKVWNLPKNIANTSGGLLTQSLCYSDGLHFAAYYPAVQEIGIWAGTAETDLAMKKCHGNDVCVICLSPDHRSLASASSDGFITVWDTETGSPRQTIGHYKEQNSKITSLAFRGNSQLASGGFGWINVWDTSDGRLNQRIEENDRSIDLIAFSISGQWLAYKSSDRGEPFPNLKVSLWDTEREQSFTISMNWSLLTIIDSLSFSADNQSLAIASFDSIYLWDVGSGTWTRAFRLYRGIRNIQVSFDATVQRRLHTQFGFLDLVDYGPDLKGMNARNSGDRSGYCEDSEFDIETLLGKRPSRESPSFRGYGFSYDLKWITKDQRRLFQIPFDYQAGHFSSEMTPVICGSTLLGISKRGGLVRMHFNV